MIRLRQESDEEDLRLLYEGDVPQLEYERVLVEDGKIVAHAGIRMVPEACIMLAKGHPASRMHWLRTLQGEFLKYMHDTGCKRIFALVPPKIYRPYLRRLASMGWLEGFQSVLFLAEDEDVN